EAEIEGRSHDLNEYAIGVDALGRPKDFSPNEDSSVRSRAYELRRKLERFYATEQPDTHVRIDIPKGSYLPRFIPVERAILSVASPEPLAEPIAPVIVTAPYPRSAIALRRPILTIVAAFLAGILLTVAGVTVWAARTPSTVPARGIWTPDLET